MSDVWRPISDYETDPQELADKELRALSSVWFDRKAELEQSQNVLTFIEKLKTEWAIETGLIERLYTLDRGITELMIDQGVSASLIPYSNGGTPPEQIVAMIEDQQSAIESVFDFVKGVRPLSTSYIKELHSLVTQHQEYVDGLDQFGKPTRIPLIHGDYKKQPNNPKGADDTLHIYCPPEHVANEMDRLVAFHLEHDEIAPEVEAAWLHHRFTQIHPFQDGNGRIARALATLVFIKANWLPLVVINDDRKKYLDALSVADHRDLKPLVTFFSALQKKRFISAIGVAHKVDMAGRVQTRIDSIRSRLVQKQVSLVQEWETAVAAAKELHELAYKRLDSVKNELEGAMREYKEFDFFVEKADDESSKNHYFRNQIISTAKKLDYYANLRPFRTWIRLVATNGNRGNILISFHSIGHDFQGVLACSGTWFLRSQTEGLGFENAGEAALSDVVFQFNYKEDRTETRKRFEEWLEGVIERGLGFWEGTL